jgi:hypothetical protein
MGTKGRPFSWEKGRRFSDLEGKKFQLTKSLMLLLICSVWAMHQNLILQWCIEVRISHPDWWPKIWIWHLKLDVNFKFRIYHLTAASFDSTISSFGCHLKMISYFWSNQLCSIKFFLVIGAVTFSQGKRKWKGKKWCWLQQTNFNL